MSYESAPATVMLATHCACCGKELVDALSVERGVGPDCFKRHGFSKPQEEMDPEEAWVRAYDVPEAGWAIVNGDAKRAANILTHRIALHQKGPQVAKWVEAIALCGFTKLAARIANRLGKITIEVEGNTLVMKAPYNPRFLDVVHTIRGQRWDGARQARLVPAASRQQLMTLLRGCYSHLMVSEGGRLISLAA